MSGFEVAGVVLGAAPIVVAALRSYKTTKRLWYRAKHIALHIDELIETLDENQVLIETSLDLLCQAIGVEAIGSDIAETGYLSSSKGAETVEELKAYLGKLYDPYEKALLRCESTLVAIVAKCDGLGPSTRVRYPALRVVPSACCTPNVNYTV